MISARTLAVFFAICVLIPFIECHWIGGWGRPPVVVGGFGYGFGGGFYPPPPPPPPPFFGPPPPPPFFGPPPPPFPFFG